MTQIYPHFKPRHASRGGFSGEHRADVKDFSQPAPLSLPTPISGLVYVIYGVLSMFLAEPAPTLFFPSDSYLLTLLLGKLTDSDRLISLN